MLGSIFKCVLCKRSATNLTSKLHSDYTALIATKCACIVPESGIQWPQCETSTDQCCTAGIPYLAIVMLLEIHAQTDSYSQLCDVDFVMGVCV